MREQFYDGVRQALATLRTDGLEKPERVILSPQGPDIEVRSPGGTPLQAINFCANNYLGLAGDARIVAASAEATKRWGAGLASVRFICGTQAIHKQLEHEIADYLGFEDALLYAACFDANGGVFEPLLGEQDAIVSDSLNHASLIDGVRLCKARRYRFETSDLNDLEARLKTARAEAAGVIIIATDGVFSMDGCIAPLAGIASLADRYDALILVDDCHATGFFGPGGRGTPAFHGVEGRIDILTGTFGKALGGGMGGFVCASREVIALLRQRSRPYLFSNALAPGVCGGALAAIQIARGPEGDRLRASLARNALDFRARMAGAGFSLPPGEHPIIPIMIGDARLALTMADALLKEGLLVTGFSFPVVPRGKARIRVQVSAAHTPAHIAFAAAAFARVNETLSNGAPA